MIRLTDFLPVPEPSSTKLKFNMRAGGGGGEAWDLLMDDHEEWLNMSRWRTKQTNNNLGNSRYLLAWAQYYPYGPQYFIFGGFFKVTPIVPAAINAYGYELEALPLHSEFIKRLIIKPERPSVRAAETSISASTRVFRINLGRRCTSSHQIRSSERSPATRTSDFGIMSCSGSSPMTNRAGATRSRASRVCT